MSLSIGIVGLPNVGKSTLFNALLKRQAALAANYPFATIEPNVGIVDVPDFRLHKLAEIVKNDWQDKYKDRAVPEKITPTVIKFYDIAGLVKGASQGEGLGNEFLGHIREVDAIVQVIRAFDDPNVSRAGSKNPKSDIEIINTELILSDLQLLEKRIQALNREVRSPNSKVYIKKLNLLKNIKEKLEEGKLASELRINNDDLEIIKDVNLLTIKPAIYVLNVDENKLNIESTQDDFIIDENEIKICAKVESELASFSDKEKAEYMTEVGINESGLDKIIKAGYETLGLETYLTMGPKEVRAWTIRKHTKAPQAAGKIHTDFERGFISCEVIMFNNLVKIGSERKAKELGKIRLEGKNYTIQDGDVVSFNFSV